MDTKSSKPIQVKFDGAMEYLDSRKFVNENLATYYSSSIQISGIDSSLLPPTIWSNRSQSCTP